MERRPHKKQKTVALKRIGSIAGRVNLMENKLKRELLKIARVKAPLEKLIVNTLVDGQNLVDAVTKVNKYTQEPL
tara:strand:+ start:17 stop:241 length:225 start_codon:yes stop_codon:yes gene_type:complete